MCTLRYYLADGRFLSGSYVANTWARIIRSLKDKIIPIFMVGLLQALVTHQQCSNMMSIKNLLSYIILMTTRMLGISIAAQ